MIDPAALAAIRATHPAGTRVRLTSTPDPYTSLRHGATGTVSLVDDFGTVHVDWDTGERLGLIPEGDRWEILSRPGPAEPKDRA